MRKPSTYLKMRVLGAIETAIGTSIRDRIRSVSQLTFVDEYSHPWKFTWRTIETWRVRYRKHGLTGVEPHTRKDKGLTRKMAPEELMEAINQALPHFRKEKTYNKMQIYRHCLDHGLFTQNRMSQTTFYKFIKVFELLKEPSEDNKRRLAFAMQYANELWQADTMFGPYISSPTGQHIQTKLIAFIDDASRLVCHAEFFPDETTNSLMTAFKQAFYKRGLPQRVYVDNGAIYKSQEITLLCARLGITLSHTPIRDGAAKGKIERFFNTVRKSFLIRNLDLSSLEVLNRQLHEWVEQSYNCEPHSSLGMKPIDRFALDITRVRFLASSPFNDELFYAQESRTVKKDNTFSFQGRRYETPGHLAGREIQVRFERSKAATPIVYHADQRFGPARPLDLIANSQIHRGEEK